MFSTRTLTLIAFALSLWACQEDDPRTQADAGAAPRAASPHSALGASDLLAVESAIDSWVATSGQTNTWLEVLHTSSELRHADLIEPLPRTSPLLVEAERLTPTGEALLAALDTGVEQALDGSGLHREAIRDALEQANRSAADARQQRRALVSYLLGLHLVPRGAQGLSARIVETLAVDPEARAYFDALVAASELQQRSAIRAELLLLDGALDFAKQSNVGNLNQLTAQEIAEFGDPVPENRRDEVLKRRLESVLGAISEAREPSTLAALFESFVPGFEQYDRLVQARQRYQSFVDAGGWEVVAPQKLHLGSKGPTVKALKRRLQAELYYSGKLDNRFDEGLEQAILHYQDKHQMDVTGKPHSLFWASLNVTAETRLAQIEENLHRWRRAHAHPTNAFVFINVADFFGELWRDGRRVHRFAIATGNKTKVCDVETETLRYANATPLQHAKLEYLVINPYWVVPPRIEKEEYLEKIVADPNWLRDNRFEFFSQGNHTVLRQLPGDDNALGRVKFIFPNEYSTFMHDTPNKKVFQKPIRAFSHGCMRVEGPLALAQLLLELEGKWDDAQRALDDELPAATIGLSQPVDVFVDYFTVRVDELGDVHFLADIYNYVADGIEPPAEGANHCRPHSGGGSASDDRAAIIAQAWAHEQSETQQVASGVAAEGSAAELDPNGALESVQDAPLVPSRSKGGEGLEASSAVDLFVPTVD